MIPIVSIFNLVSLLFLIFIVIRLYIPFIRTKDRNIRYFFATFLFLAVMEFLLSAPGLIVKDLITIGIIFNVYPFFIFLSLGFWGAIPFNILKKETIGAIFLITMIMIAIIVTAINLHNTQPVVIYELAPFIYYEGVRQASINIFTGTVTMSIFLFISFFFFIKGVKSTERYVRMRSFLIGSGGILFILSAVANFVFGSSINSHTYLASLAASILLILSSIAIFFGVIYKESKNFYNPQAK